MGVLVQRNDGLTDLRINTPYDVCRSVPDYLQCWHSAFGIRHSACHAIGKGVGCFCADDAALLKALRIDVGGAKHRADDLGAQAPSAAC